MIEFNLRADKDTERWNALQKNFDYVHGEIQKYFDERSKKWNEHNSYQRKYAIGCLRDSIEVAKLVIPAVISIRKELNLPFDADGYRVLMHEQMAQLESTLRDFMHDFENASDA